MSRSDGEARIAQVLQQAFPQSSSIRVNDISGGCGSMYNIFVESVEFEGLKRLEQHQKVTEALKAEVKQMHGLKIKTNVPN